MSSHVYVVSQEIKCKNDRSCFRGKIKNFMLELVTFLSIWWVALNHRVWQATNLSSGSERSKCSATLMAMADIST